MHHINWSLVGGWTVPGLIGLVAGIVVGYLTHRFQRRRDDALWEREKLKLEMQWQFEKEKLDLQWQLKLKELELQYLKGNEEKLRAELMKGVDKPEEIIRAQHKLNWVLRSQIYENQSSYLFHSLVEIISSSTALVKRQTQALVHLRDKRTEIARIIDVKSEVERYLAELKLQSVGEQKKSAIECSPNASGKDEDH